MHRRVQVLVQTAQLGVGQRSRRSLRRQAGPPQRLVGQQVPDAGHVGLIQDHCAHRGASLLYGRVEQRGIACADGGEDDYTAAAAHI